MEKVYSVDLGKIVDLPKVSTDFYSKLQDLIILTSTPDILVEIKNEKGDEEYYKFIAPLFEFIAAAEEKFIQDGVATLSEAPPIPPGEI